MSDKIFLDTNILLYAYDLDAGRKQAIASEIVRERLRNPSGTAISVQVLQEFHVNFLRSGGATEDLSLLIQDFSQWRIVDNTRLLYRLGYSLQQRWQLSLWNAMILAAAHASRCSLVYSEDFNQDQDYGGVRVLNPFTGQT